MEEPTRKRQPSRGTCAFCGGTFGKASMTRHLAACASRRASWEAPASIAKPAGVRTPPRGRTKPSRGRQTEGTRLYHLVVAGRYARDYWMHLEAAGGRKLSELDAFLRDTWLECCGHLSAFRIEGTSYNSHPDVEFGNVFSGLFGRAPERDMRVRLDKVLRPGLSCSYEYDFGTTTDLTLKVVAERQGQDDDKAIKVLARNEPPPIVCVECERPATVVCSQCIYEGVGWLCDECAKEHECGEETLLPVVNSPRVGMCGYTGDAW